MKFVRTSNVILIKFFAIYLFILIIKGSFLISVCTSINLIGLSVFVIIKIIIEILKYLKLGKTISSYKSRSYYLHFFINAKIFSNF